MQWKWNQIFPIEIFPRCKVRRKKRFCNFHSVTIFIEVQSSIEYETCKLSVFLPSLLNFATDYFFFKTNVKFHVSVESA